MSKNKKLKKELKSWVILLGIFAILYLTGMYTHIAATLQRGIVATGLVRPDTNLDLEAAPDLDYNFTLVDVNGEKLRFATLKNKVVFVNFWATWCPPCLAEMPDINKLYQGIDKDQMAFVMISTDEDFEKAKAFVQKKDFGFPIYQLYDRIPPQFESNVLPTTYIISKDGKVATSKSGFASYDTNEFKTYLNALINR